MSQRNCPTVHIDARPIPVKLSAIGQRLSRKSFVNLNQIETTTRTLSLDWGEEVTAELPLAPP